MTSPTPAILPERGLGDRLTAIFWRHPRLLLAVLLTPPLLWLGLVYLGSLAALLLQSFYSIDEAEAPWNTGTKSVCKPNSGNFKKGQISWNKKPVGYERICSKDGYVLVKTVEPNVFELKHRVIWEKENSPVPKNQVLAFKNQDKTDCRLDNLILMSRTDMVRYNQSYQKLANPENNESCLLMAKVKNMKHQLLKEVS